MQMAKQFVCHKPVRLPHSKRPKIKNNNLLQFCSSDISPQSLSPSQTQYAETQRPELAHWNWSWLHAEHTNISAWNIIR